MARSIRLIALGAVAVALSGCTTIRSDQVLQNLEGCSRHYNGAVSVGVGGGFTGTVQIDCEPRAIRD